MENNHQEVAMRFKATACGTFLVFLGFTAMWAQSTGTPTTGERTVEEAYVQDSTEVMILRVEAMSETKESKLNALNGMREAIQAGRTGEDMRRLLEYLSQEGIVYVTREAGLGRPKNNFPDLRMYACDLLGEFKTAAAKDTLLRVLLTEQEPMVLGAAIRSLGKIGINDGNETSQTIALIANRFDILYPDNSMAFEVLIAYERLARETGGLSDPLAFEAIIKISKGNYVKPVKTKALELIKVLRKAGTK